MDNPAHPHNTLDKLKSSFSNRLLQLQETFPSYGNKSFHLICLCQSHSHTTGLNLPDTCVTVKPYTPSHLLGHILNVLILLSHTFNANDDQSILRIVNISDTVINCSYTVHMQPVHKLNICHYFCVYTHILLLLLLLFLLLSYT